MLKTKIAVFVSGGGTNLQALIDAAERGEMPSGEIALVLASNETAYALTRAAENGIPSAVVKRKDFPSQLAYEEKMKEILRENGVEMIVLAYFGLSETDHQRTSRADSIFLRKGLLWAACA